MELILNADLPILINCSYLKKYAAYDIMLKQGYLYDSELSYNDSRVYIHTDLNKIVCVFRGTTTFFDWFTDFFCLFGLKRITPRYYRTIKIINKIKDKYKTDEIYAVGHSAGGFWCEQSEATYKITYNKMVALQDICKIIPETQKDVREEFDVVSILELTQKCEMKETIDIRDLNPLHAHTTEDLIKHRDSISI